MLNIFIVYLLSRIIVFERDKLVHKLNILSQNCQTSGKMFELLIFTLETKLVRILFTSQRQL